jgi:catechol 2,3-dioxygenase
MARSPVLHHVNLKTTRLQAMIDWYAAVIGTEVIFQNAISVWLSNDRANHRVALLAFPAFEDDPGKPARTGLHHSAYEFESFDELIGTYARLRADEITPAFCLDHGMTLSLYYEDPDRNHVELQVDTFGDWETSTQWMRTSPVFEANPIGVFFDPERVLEAHESGMEFAEIHRRAYAGEYLADPTPDLGMPGPDAP